MVMVALIVVFYLLRYFFASATAYTSALAPMMIAAALAMPEIPLPGVLPDGWCGNWSGEHSYTIRHRPQSDLLRQWLSANGGLLATGGRIFGLIFLVLLVITGLLWMPVVLL
ncbi:putative tartrate carrier protein [Escherichia coli]|nr:putative tartrate carrier protein [Escherichia coli]